MTIQEIRNKLAQGSTITRVDCVKINKKGRGAKDFFYIDGEKIRESQFNNLREDLVEIPCERILTRMFKFKS